MTRKYTLAELRQGRNLTQRELAKLLGFSYGAIAMYELGERTPGLNRAKQIAKFFKVPTDSIIFGQDVRGVKAGATGTDGS